MTSPDRCGSGDLHPGGYSDFAKEEPAEHAGDLSPTTEAGRRLREAPTLVHHLMRLCEPVTPP